MKTLETQNKVNLYSHMYHHYDYLKTMYKECFIQGFKNKCLIVKEKAEETYKVLMKKECNSTESARMGTIPILEDEVIVICKNKTETLQNSVA
jgi:hypothetical protein